MFFGWKVVGVVFVVAFFGFGIGFYAAAVFLAATHERQGWPISLISFAITAYFVLGASLTLFCGDAYERFGPRRVVLGTMGALALGVVLLGCATRPWQMYAAFGVMAFGWAGMGGAAINALVAPWFDRRRGLAVSIAFNGATAGGAVMVPLWTVLIARLGFPSAATVVAGGMAILLIPLALRYLHRSPADIGLRPDGVLEGAGDPARRPARSTVRRRDLVRSRRFWTISAPFALALFAQVGVLTHAISYLAPRLGPHGAALGVSLATIAAIVGRLAAGLVVDRIDRRTVVAGNFLVQEVAVTALIAASSPPALYAACALFGLGVGNVTSFPALIVQAEYPSEHFNRTVSLIVAINQFTFAFGPGVLGVMRDLSGSYAVAFALGAACETLAAIVVLMKPRDLPTARALRRSRGTHAPT